MITLDIFTENIRKYNRTKYLKTVIEKVNNGEGYMSIYGYHVIFNKYLIGYSKNNMDGIIHHQLK